MFRSICLALVLLGCAPLPEGSSPDDAGLPPDDDIGAAREELLLGTTYLHCPESGHRSNVFVPTWAGHYPTTLEFRNFSRSHAVEVSWPNGVGRETMVILPTPNPDPWVLPPARTISRSWWGARIIVGYDRAFPASPPDAPFEPCPRVSVRAW